MPKLWDKTIQAHRQMVREAILDTAWSLVTEHGVLSVTMSRIAEESGVGRATLYKYFADVESILTAWHERHTTAHLTQLSHLANQEGDAAERLKAVLDGYALIAHDRSRHAGELVALLHRGEPIRHAHERLIGLISGLLTEAAAQNEARDDIAPGELARYCVHALGAAADLQSKAAVHRLVQVTLDALRPRA